jgi:uncharacterized protein (UPF0276 family)
VTRLGLPVLGQGIGLRTAHYREILADTSAEATRGLGFLEVISENFMVAGGNPRRVLRAARERYPIVMHGVSMSLGSADPLDEDYLAALRALADEVEPAWLSDHLCWGGVDGRRGHDLWPMPYTEEALAHVAARVAHAQERLGRRLLIENVSAYARFAADEMSECAFLAELCRRADCGLLLDVNNVFVSAHNLGFDAGAFLDALPAERVGQIHLAGHTDLGTHLLDSHDAPVSEPVWALYRQAVARFGAVATLIERDDHLPALAELCDEARRAGDIVDEVLEVRRAA